MDRFIFNGWRLGEDKKTLSFSYLLEHGAEKFEFTELIGLPEPLSDEELKAALPACDFLSLALGTSYWKTFIPKKIETPYVALSPAQARFWNTVYTKGFGEFFYKNKIDFRGLVDFPFAEVKGSPLEKRPARKPSGRGSLVLLGGGKDSLVSAELVRGEKKPFSFFALGNFPLLRRAASALGAELVTIDRRLDPALLELNKRPGTLNGHVPVSLIYMGSAMLTALLYGFDEVVISTEGSASYGNVEYLGEEINHQWSKSQEAEELLRAYFHDHIAPGVGFRSPLRQFSELKVAELFSRHPEYFDSFSSCNKNFLQSGVSEKLWCGECPKCAFVFSILAPFLSKERLVDIFGKNLFADEALVPLYRELWGLEATKPFECVGTPEETKLAFFLTHRRGEYEHDVAMKRFLASFGQELGSLEALEPSLLPQSP